MTVESATLAMPVIPRWRAYLKLCKARVVLLMLLTAWVGMCLATPHLVPWQPLVFGLTGIALIASGAAVVNHLVDRHIDAKMFRTENRPMPMQQISPQQALTFALSLSTLGMFILIAFVNPLTALLSFIALIGYAVIYTMYLKHATPQNIVIGGIAGAMPPLLGWTAVTNSLDANGLLLVLIIFIWTPPHFWALAIHRRAEYAKADIPMLPVTHGVKFTKIQILLYTILLIACTTLPFITGMCGWLYLIGSLALGSRFLYWSLKLMFSDNSLVALKTFKFSIYYLMFLFIILLADHYCGTYF